MLPLAYFLKMMLCSAVFYGYYLLALRNKRFHQYNRFYLLLTLIASWIIPLLQFDLPANGTTEKPLASALLYISNRNVAFEAEPALKTVNGFDWMQWLPVLYFLVAAILMGTLVFALIQIYRIYRAARKTKSEAVTIVETEASAAPFSFFHLLFWNNAIDPQSEAGKRIYLHELTHVREQHSIDKLLLQLNSIFAWFNPISWLLKKEMDLIHEFIADNKAIQDADTAAFASMLLTATFPAKQNRLTHPFFFSPVKRRLQMILSTKTERFTYLRRLIALPLLAITILLFAFKKPAAYGPVQKAKSELVLVLDAAHGGNDDGATSADGTKEKALTLAICKKLEELSGEYNIRIRCTRSSDISKSLPERLQWSNASPADLFLSVHINQSSAVRDNSYQLGVNPKSRNYPKSLQLANAIGQKLQQQKLAVEIVDHSMAYILREIQHPALLIECGNLDDPENMALLQNKERMELMCRALLSGMVDYQSQLSRKK